MQTTKEPVKTQLKKESWTTLEEDYIAFLLPVPKVVHERVLESIGLSKFYKVYSLKMLSISTKIYTQKNEIILI
jgi:hypothetical protein